MKNISNKLKTLKISTKIIIAITATPAILILAIVLFLSYKAKQIQNETAHNDLRNTAKYYAAVIDAELEIPIDAARTMAQIFEQKDDIPIDMRREIINNQLKAVLTQNENFFSVWTCWEPNALDGMDNRFVNTNAHDQTGRFIPYFHRNNDSILVRALRKYNIEGKGDYYLLAKKTDKEIILNPYSCKIDDKDIMMTSLVVPIHINDKFVGAVGIDISIENIQQLIAKIKPYKTGYSFLVANDGILAAHEDTIYQNKSFFDYIDENTKSTFLNTIKDTGCMRYNTVSVHSNKTSSYEGASIKIGKSTNYWMFFVSVPNKTLLASINAINIIALIAVLFSLLIIGLIAWLIGQDLETNIRKILKEVGLLIDAGTSGKLSFRAKEQNVHNDFKPIITGFNAVLDTVIAPINLTSDYIEQLSNGNMPELITEDYQGDFNAIKNNLNNVINVLSSLSDEMNTMYKKQAAGDYEYTMDDTPFKGVYQQVAQGYNQTVKLHVDNVLMILDITGQYGEGNFTNKMPDLPGKQIIITQIISSVRKNLLNVIYDITQLSKSASEEKFETRANIDKHKGEYKNIIGGINNIMDKVIAKVYWYEQLLDAIPMGVVSMTNDMDFSYLNKKAIQIIGKPKEDLINRQCHNWESPNCKTKNCAIEEFKKGQKQSFFNNSNKEFQIDVSEIIDINGNKIGFIETVLDISQTKYSADYNNTEIKRLSSNLKLIAEGNFEIDTQIAPAAKHTADGHQHFSTIYESLNLLVLSVKTLSEDIKEVTDSATSGRISAKANASKHKGEYAKIIVGLNNTLTAITTPLGHLVKGLAGFTKNIRNGELNNRLSLDNQNIAEFSIITKSINSAFDAIINPLNVASEYISKMSKGDIPQLITDNYKGDFNEIKSSINELINIDQQIINNAKQIADGNLTIKLRKRSQNDELIMAFEDMTTKLNNVVKQINESADNVAIGSTEISNSATNMAQGANEQAASIEEVSASIEQMRATVNQNSENAKATKNTALKSASEIEIGSKSVQSTVDAMRTIIEKIQIVTEIADKTDLLAINAAIEAARAGEYGEGFAVVASEIRKLAEMSKEAAKEINSVSKTSLRAAEKSGKLLDDIVPQIKTTASLVEDISLASDEQNIGIEQITTTVSLLNDVSQQNAAAAEELSTGSEELTSQADSLREIISYFSIENETSENKTKVKRQNLNKGTSIKLTDNEFEKF